MIFRVTDYAHLETLSKDELIGMVENAKLDKLLHRQWLAKAEEELAKYKTPPQTM